MAMQGFNGLGWFLCGAVVAPACYLVNSYGAAEQAKLDAVKAAIVQAHKDIRGLETDFQSRANLEQLERWNGEVLALAAPAPGQYLASEAALADLGQPAEVQLAALVVPAGAQVAQPVAAVVTAAAEPVQPGPAPAPTGKSVAQQDRELRNLMKKADRHAVAMVDDRLLSVSTMNDLEKLAEREKLKLR